MKTYLKDFSKMAKRGIAYLPIGTLEWHGNHLPIETDYLVAVKLCEMLAKKKPGYILPPMYLGTDKHKIVNNKKLVGMDRYLGKKLAGNLYYLDPALFEKMIVSLGKNLKSQGFKKIFLIAGHAGSGHLNTLAKAVKKQSGLVLVNPWENLNIDAKHADEYETSILWACYPEEKIISRKMKIPASDDCFRFYGYDPRKKASVGLGRKILKEMVENCLREIKKYL
ncbi:MAG: creatininase family protein [Candidatus Moranbacteria bacterium]|nr:creatininase family protein [Candidatus Moranbacteria bacterium]